MSQLCRVLRAGVVVCAALALGPVADGQSLTLTSASSCVHDAGRTVVVSVVMTGATQPVVGGQFFLQYDAGVLSLVSASPAGPFTQEVYRDTPVPVGSVGLIDYAVGVPGAGPGTAANTAMATFTFHANQDVCATSTGFLVFRVTPPGFPPSRLTNSSGDPITAVLNNLSSLRIDTSPPTISCAGAVAINADAGGCTAAVTSFSASGAWEVFGDGVLAALTSGNVVADLPSRSGGTFGVSGVDYTPATILTFSSLTTLSTDYAMLQGCFSSGSPHISIGVDTNHNGDPDGYVRVLLGTSPTFTDCPTPGQWTSTGNLITDPGLRWDLTQFGGPPNASHAAAVALLGANPITDIAFVTDATAHPDQDVQIDNFRVNSQMQTFDAGTPGVSDACTASPTVSAVRSDGQPLSAPYPTGTTTITWSATDTCGNVSTCPQFVTVNPFNTMTATVQLEGVSAGPFDRCITFGLPSGGCATPITQLMTFTNGLATADVNIPCGLYTCLTARDRLHTLRRTANAGHFDISGTHYYASFVGADMLLGGNLNDDNVIDILDFGVFVGEYGHTYATPSTTCSTPFPHADISGNGTVFSEDFTFIHNHFLTFNEADCCGITGLHGLPRVSVPDLIASGRGDLVIADLNHDGWLDEADMAVFAAHGGIPACSADFNGDGDIGTDADIEAFFECLAGNCCRTCGSADFDGDGATGTDADIESFFRVLSGGPC